eukprot:jgi/Mesvir1/3661/Mv14952-RA.1
MDDAEDDVTQNEEEVADLPLMKQVFMNEKAAPEILVYQEDLVERIKEYINNQTSVIEDMEKGQHESLQAIVYTMDVERVQYLLRSYLRTRMAKIERYALNILSDRTLCSRLSEPELAFAKGFVDLMDAHFRSSVLDHLPATSRSLLRQSNTSTSEDMIPTPDLDGFVFCRCKQTIGSVAIDGRGVDTVDLEEGDLYILRYRPVALLISQGLIEMV